MKTQLKGNSSIEDVMIMTLGNKSENSKYALLLLNHHTYTHAMRLGMRNCTCRELKMSKPSFSNTAFTLYDF